MNQTKIGNRVVLIGRTPPARQKVSNREPPNQRPITHRIIVIRNGELVGGKPGR